MTRLNLGCGSNKIDDCMNVDINESNNPDIVFDIKLEFPLARGLFDEVYLFHTIEHIEKTHHRHIFLEVNRVLKEGGIFYLSYPEFAKICNNWLTNFQGKREFWEATIYGRQLYPSDYHVAAMDSDNVKNELEICGFYDLKFYPEPEGDWYNTVVRAVRTVPQKMYEEVLFNEVFLDDPVRRASQTE